MLLVVSQRRGGLSATLFPDSDAFLDPPEEMADLTATLPIIDIDVFRAGGPGALVECDKDSRVSQFTLAVIDSRSIRQPMRSLHTVPSSYTTLA